MERLACEVQNGRALLYSPCLCVSVVKGMARATTILAVAVLLAAWLAPGCAASKPTTQPSTIEQRQDAALRDPANYKLPANPNGRDGGIGNLDGPGLNKDLNDVFNP